MWYRLNVFLPSLIILAALVLVGVVYIRIIKWRLKGKLNSIAWVQEHHRQISWTISFPLLYVFGPAIEELIFRAPLVVLFENISSGAWWGISISAILFALTHWWTQNYHAGWIMFSRERESNPSSDDFMAESTRIKKEHAKEIRNRRIYQMTMTIWLGFAAGYFAVKYQSVWLAVGIHVAWNLLMPLIVTIFIINVMLVGGALWQALLPLRRRFSSNAE